MPKRVLITGGTGNLGGHVREHLLRRGYTVRIMSRREPRPGEDHGVEWAVAQLTSGQGIGDALQGVDVVVHAASSPLRRGVEIDGGKHLVTAARRERIEHLVYISILGIEEISFSYYATKLDAEGIVKDSGLEYTIVRSAQFHKFVHMIIEGLAKLPVILLPKGWRFQPIYAGDVARLVADAVDRGPRDQTRYIAGPEILELDAMLRSWKAANGVKKPVIRVPVPGGLSAGFRKGHNTAAEYAIDGIRWDQYLRLESQQDRSPAMSQGQTA